MSVAARQVPVGQQHFRAVVFQVAVDLALPQPFEPRVGLVVARAVERVHLEAAQERLDAAGPVVLAGVGDRVPDLHDAEEQGDGHSDDDQAPG
ncbi:hypothetical protein HDA40_006340 [Hamadaea flava]|uniref:Uncharacterized protein n=1 Tax=Hamadaea flava TaxID=1742688 RepID=A0ABV8LTL3_9ACTN|nr:hypothetical protein [Hamadaea flava]MCP2327833.1 hypothetical protein [Hamadaea flava]